jgi:hypothetical protein
LLVNDAIVYEHAEDVERHIVENAPIDIRLAQELASLRCKHRLCPHHAAIDERRFSGKSRVSEMSHRILNAIERLQAKAPAEGERVHLTVINGSYSRDKLCVQPANHHMDLAPPSPAGLFLLSLAGVADWLEKRKP